MTSWIFFLWSTVFAAESTQPWDPSLHQATSCAEVENVLSDYVKNRWNGGYFGVKEPIMVDDAGGSVEMPSVADKESVSGDDKWWGGSDFSVTNVQKAWTDEPDILKSNGKYLYYLDSQNGKLRVLDPKTKVEVVSIVLPKDYWGTQMLIYKDKLLLLWTKSMPYMSAKISQSSYVQRDQQTLVAIYSIVQARPQLLKAHTFDGWLQDSRIANNKLVLVSTQSLYRGPIYRAMEDKAITNSSSSVSMPSVSLKATDILPTWTTLTPTTTKWRNRKVRAITRKSTATVNCNQVMYKKADVLRKNQGYYAGESLTTIVNIALDELNAQPQMKTIITNSAQIHVTPASIYLISPSYMRQPFVCPADAICMPWRWEGEYTSIYKFDQANLSYKYASIVEWTTWNQYSMDENKNWVFRIVTSSQQNGKVNSNVYTVAKDGKVAWKLQNIAPGENFYWVRFIWDYLYLITYRQIDPLYVIDTSNITKPSILWELKMPWYSTYLHPYAPMKDGVQYLIGLGYDTAINENWGEQQLWIKMDLYKVDYNKKDAKWKISVSQAWTETLWKAWTQTEAVYNPRMFVFNPTTKELLLPIVLADTRKVQSCNIIYGEDGKSEIGRSCYPYEQSFATFAWVKWWTLGVDKLTETISADYIKQLKNPYGDNVMAETPSAVEPRWFVAMQPRVGYIGDSYYFIWNQFATFFTKQNPTGTLVNYK